MTTTVPVKDGEQTFEQEVFLFPASFAQKRLWFLDQLAPGTALYNIPAAFRIVGPLDLAALNRSLQEVLRRHESLRTCFRSNKGEAQQVIVQEMAFELAVVDLSSQEIRETMIQKRVQEFLDAPFDLQQAPLWRIKLFRIAENDHVMATVMHHIISDGWSIAVLWKEISLLYEAFTTGKRSPLPELSIQYPDFSAWQQEFLQGKVLEKQLEYWKTQLAGFTALNLPFDRPRPSVGKGDGGTLTFQLDLALSDKLQSLSRQHAASLYMTLLAAFQVLLFHYTGQQDILVAAAIAGRTRPEIEELIGFFVNTLLLRTKFSSQWTFHELLRKVKETTLGAYEHQDVPFERLVQEIVPDRDAQAGMIFQVTFTLENVPAVGTRLGKAEIVSFPYNINAAKFDLSVSLDQTSEGITLALIYDQELFESGTIKGIFQHYLVLLRNVVENPDQKLSGFSILSPEEQRALRAGWSTPARGNLSPETICARVKHWALQTPDAPAILGGINYKQLNQRANQLARFLRTQGVKTGLRIALGFDQPDKLLVAILGVLKAGAVFVPLSPQDPILRARKIVADARISLILTEMGSAERWSTLEAPLLNLDLRRAELAAQNIEEPDVPIDPSALACVLYRPAPGDKPHGVLIHHGALCGRRFGTDMDFLPSDRVAQTLSFSYELSPFGIFSALQAGACIVPVLADPAPTAADLADLVQRSGATVMFIWAAMLADMTRQTPWIFQQFRLLFCGDRFEAWKDLRENLDPDIVSRVHWFYGAAELSGWILSSRITQLDLEMEIAPVDQMAQGSRLYLLNEEMKPVPEDALGELYISAPGVAMGYEGQPARTSESFVLDPFSGEAGQHLYRTGEMCRRRSGGRLQFCGRQDRRTKIHEARVEPAEIEAILLQHNQVREAAVLPHKQAGRQEPNLIAFVAATQEEWNVEELRQYLWDRLPEIMLPMEYTRLDALPRTSEGAPDWAALTKMAEGSEESEGSSAAYVAPRNGIEKQLADIWTHTFQVEQVGIHDSFFRLGGHSLFATIMVAQIMDAFNVDLPVRRLFEAPTIEKLATIIEHLTLKDTAEKEEDEAPPILVELQGKGAAAPFFCIHPVGGHVFCYTELAAALGEERPFYGLQAPRGRNDLSLTTVEEIADLYLQEIRNVQPKGPYLLGGWSVGGIIAWQVAKQMKVEGEAVSMLALIDTNLPPKNLPNKELDEMPLLTWFAIDLCQLLGKDVEQFSERFLRLDASGQFEMMVTELQREGVLPQDPSLAQKKIRDFYDMFQRNAQAVRNYQLSPMEQDIVIFEAADGEPAGTLGEHWAAWSGEVDRTTIPGNHYTILRQPNVSILASHLRSCLQGA